MHLSRVDANKHNMSSPAKIVNLPNLPIGLLESAEPEVFPVKGPKSDPSKISLQLK